ncbi:MAG: hypothetical protein HKN22_00585 [Bacteroidia bacterium]|nr:hypothetical protein [Bacteroidia bacterium]
MGLVVGLLLVGSTGGLLAQDDLMSLLGEEEETTEFTKASFKTTRVINAHSLESTSPGVLDLKIQHRFGFVNGGIKELYGLDQASIRIGLDYGINDHLMVGFGRSSFEKTLDAFVKLKMLRQSTGKRKMPITAAAHSSIMLYTLPFTDPERPNYFSSRLYYSNSLIIGRKFSEAFSAQIIPGLLHRNLVELKSERNDVWYLGGALRQKLSKRTSLNLEYFYVFPDQIQDGFNNSISFGFDLETGGHVFQLHFSNSTGMNEKTFIAENRGDFWNGDIHFGFNVSRVFTVKDTRGSSKH